MELKTFVKVGSISNLSDARFCAGFGVDLLGFNLNPTSDNHLSVDQSNEIMGWIAGPEFVAELDQMPLEQILTLQAKNNFPLLQVDDPEVGSALVARGYNIILNLTIHSEEDLLILNEIERAPTSFRFITINCDAPQLYPVIEDALSKVKNQQLIRGYDVELSQLDRMLTQDIFMGVELKGSQEEKPGFKEYDDLADILEALEVED